MNPRPGSTILITGATGFIGHYVLAELLHRRDRCVALLRAPLTRSVSRLAKLLAPLGLDLETQVAQGRLTFVEGTLGRKEFRLPAHTISRIVHCAGVTRLDEFNSEDTRRVNYEGAQQLLLIAQRHGVRELHLMSSAYRCGRMRSPVAEDDVAPPSFYNTTSEASGTPSALGASGDDSIKQGSRSIAPRLSSATVRLGESRDWRASISSPRR